MSNRLARAWDSLWGRGEFSVTVPSMDGALRPNTRLDEAPALLDAADVDDLAVAGDRLYFSKGNQLLALDEPGGRPQPVKAYPGSISALAASPDGRLAVGLDAGGILVRMSAGSDEEVRIDLPGAKVSPTAMAFAPDGALLICVGSSLNPASEWKRDLMMLGSSGAVWRVPAGGQPELLGRDMAFPAGVALDEKGGLVVSEAWSHRLIRRRPNGGWETLLADIPGYPGRFAPLTSGRGHWLSVFAPRSQMIEFVLREKDYRERMIADVPEDFWMAPTLRAGRSFKEPLQGGGVKHLGIHKPWGPTRSYGLLVRLNEDFQPVDSFHSRSDGRRHGITSAADWKRETIVASKGDGVLLRLAEADITEQP